MWLTPRSFVYSVDTAASDERFSVLVRRAFLAQGGGSDR